MSRISLPICMILLLNAGILGQAVSLTGKVTNSTGGLPLKDVVVTLMHRPGVTGITDADGVYRLSSSNTAVPNSRRESVFGGQISGNSLRFSVAKKTMISIDIFAASGGKAKSVVNKKLFPPGNFNVALAMNGLASNLYLVRFTRDNVSTVQRFVPITGWKVTNGFTPVVNRDAFLTKSAAVADTLVFALPGFALGLVPISDYSSSTAYNSVLQAYPKYKNMRQVPGGTFQMGLVDSMADWGPVHPVTVSPFWIDTTEVTQAEYQTVMNTNPSHFTDEVNYPVEYLTWFDAVLFCNERSKRDGFDTMYRYSSVTGTAGNGCSGLGNLSLDKSGSKPGYRLPTEAEWEYACRAGTKSLYYWGDSMDDDYCWHFSNSNSTTHPVASLQPNLFGLYDMSGNVWEFCNDWEAPYTAGAQTNPTGPATGGSKIIRGASYAYNSFNYWYSACRNGYTPDYQDYHWNTGFRCVRQAM